jgi:hypothetical protein
MGEGLAHNVYLGHSIWVHDSDGESWLSPRVQSLLKEWELKQDRTPAPASANEQDAQRAGTAHQARVKVMNGLHGVLLLSLFLAAAYELQESLVCGNEVLIRKRISAENARPHRDDAALI